MTLFHFANCVVLAYAPYVIAYKYSSLSDYASIWKCAQAAAVYFLTQFLKLMVVATFFPDTAPIAATLTTGAVDSYHDVYEFNLISELIKNSVDMIDIAGLHIAIGVIGTAGKGATRFFVAGLGWAAAHAVATTFVPLAVEARTAGFQWTFVQTALGANLDLVLYVSMAALVWTFQRIDLPPAARNFAGVLIVLCVFHNVIYQIFAHKFHFYSWSLLGAKVSFVGLLFISTLSTYAQIGSNSYNGTTMQQNANMVAASYAPASGVARHQKTNNHYKIA